MSEKLDGVRAYWDGSQFVSRLGNRYIAPEWFVESLPDIPLDGELWVGRKQFQKTVSIVRRADAGAGWRDVSFVVFDAPGHGGVFEDRLDHARQFFTDNPSEHARVLAHERCTDMAHLQTELERVEGLGGEGLMLRRPGSRYEVGRSTSLLKVKTFHDAEARVIDHLAGSGRHKGRLGALRVVTPGGIEFSVGTGLSDAERSSPPAVGAIITYRYQELSNTGVPRFPVYVGERHDFAWPESAAPIAKSKKTAAKSKSTAAKSKSTAAAAPLPTVPNSDSAELVRYLQLSDGKSHKFWEVTVTGTQHIVRYGRIGSDGTRKLKTFATPEAARSDADKQAARKLGKGYIEVESESGPA
jgi:DNA ligase-1